jgi:hypothetical protein
MTVPRGDGVGRSASRLQLFDQRHRGGGRADFALVDEIDGGGSDFESRFNILTEAVALFLLWDTLARTGCDGTVKSKTT